MYGMMTMIDIMIMRLLSGTMVIENRRPRKQRLRKSFTHRLAPGSCNGLVYARRGEKAVDVTDSCF